MTETIERYIRVSDGRRIFVRDTPGPESASKTPLLCLHGLTRNSKDFAGIAKVYGCERRVISPDIRGRGQSDYDRQWQNYILPTYVSDMRDVLCALGAHEIVVIGTSMGGLMGMGMASAMPTMLRGLVINDVGPRVERGGLSVIERYMESNPRFETWEQAGQHMRDAFEDQIPLGDDPEIWTLAARGSYRTDQRGRIVFDWDPGIWTALKNDKTQTYDLWGHFEAASRFPMLTVRGERSTILSASLLQEMQARNPEMAAVTVPERGHAPTLSEPVSAEALREFLNSV